jgi:hypothetical protein
MNKDALFMVRVAVSCAVCLGFVFGWIAGRAVV